MTQDELWLAKWQEAMYSGGYPFSVPVIPIHFSGVSCP